MNCRHCTTPLQHVFVDLGFAPPSNAYLTEDDLKRPETYFPLKTQVCHHCWLVQTEDYTEAEQLFSPDYAYFSSTSSSWLAHAAEFSASIIPRLGLNQESLVMEIAANDGYLLKNFVAAGIPCLGIEPTASTADAARRSGIPILQEFFGERLGAELQNGGQQADLIIGNNVYAHVPDINDFTRGLKAALKPGGTITLEFPHLLNLIQQAQFDTIYHEHFSYLSLYTVNHIFQAAGLRLWDVEKLPTHGGSLRVYGCHDDDQRQTGHAVTELLREEKICGLQDAVIYGSFQARANSIKDALIAFLIEQKHQGKTVAAYGAAAKGNTLLNYAGIRPDLLPFVCDAAPAKQGRFMPGSHIPILSPQALREQPLDYVLILPWNIAAEVTTQLADLARLGTRFVTAVPKLAVL